PSAIAQQAALAAFEPESLATAQGYRERFREQGDYLLGELTRLGFSFPAMPDGAFYGYADVCALTDDSYGFCLRLCDEAGVLMTPGRDFGQVAPERYVRVSYTKPLSALAEGVRRIEQFLKS
ncbi:MAG: aminotransferase class I/II-fold pyridoxal phosphate-dependent enzyme, partial [Burkholderiaceae bacterium]